MEITRTWVIPRETTLQYPDMPEAMRFLSSLGMDTYLEYKIDEDFQRDCVIVTQKQPLRTPPDQPTRAEREMLRELVDDEELWFYSREIGHCKTGDTYYATEMPDLSTFQPGPFEPVAVVLKKLRVQKYGATVNFERFEILAAVDLDTLEVYWARKA